MVKNITAIIPIYIPFAKMYSKELAIQYNPKNNWPKLKEETISNGTHQNRMDKRI